MKENTSKTNCHHCVKIPHIHGVRQKTEIDVCVIRIKFKIFAFFLPVEHHHLKETPIVFDVWVQS